MIHGVSLFGNTEEGPSNPDSPLLHDGPPQNGPWSFWKLRPGETMRRSSIPLRLCSALGAVLKSQAKRLKQSVPLFLLIGYSVLGGALFFYVENPKEQQLLENNRAVDEANAIRFEGVRRMLTERFWEIHREASHLNRSEGRLFLRRSVHKTLEWYDDQRSGVRNSTYVPQWTSFWNAVFYAGTVYTTIGYGNIVPVSNIGRILTMIYAFFGIPIMFLVLHKLGRLFCIGLLKMWELFLLVRVKYCTTCRFFRRKKARKRPNTGQNLAAAAIKQFGGGQMTDGQISIEGCSSSDETSELQDVEKQFHDVPISLAVIITFGWTLMCSGLFVIWEDWTYFESFYFFFISLTTIGLGDVVPLDLKKMAMVFGVVIVGLSLVTMCINLVQVKVEHALQESVLLIMKKYQEAQINGEATGYMEDDGSEVDDDPDDKDSHKTGKLGGKMNEIFNPKEKWLKQLMGKKQKDILINEWNKRAAMIPRFTQTDYPVCMLSELTEAQSIIHSLEARLRNAGLELDLHLKAALLKSASLHSYTQTDRTTCSDWSGQTELPYEASSVKSRSPDADPSVNQSYSWDHMNECSVCGYQRFPAFNDNYLRFLHTIQHRQQHNNNHDSREQSSDNRSCTSHTLNAPDAVSSSGIFTTSTQSDQCLSLYFLPKRHHGVPSTSEGDNRPDRQTRNYSSSVTYKRWKNPPLDDSVRHVLAAQADNIDLAKSRPPVICRPRTGRTPITLGVQSFWGYGSPIPPRRRDSSKHTESLADDVSSDIKSEQQSECNQDHAKLHSKNTEKSTKDEVIEEAKEKQEYVEPMQPPISAPKKKTCDERQHQKDTPSEVGRHQHKNIKQNSPRLQIACNPKSAETPDGKFNSKLLLNLLAVDAKSAKTTNAVTRRVSAAVSKFPKLRTQKSAYENVAFPEYYERDTEHNPSSASNPFFYTNQAVISRNQTNMSISESASPNVFLTSVNSTSVDALSNDSIFVQQTSSEDKNRNDAVQTDREMCQTHRSPQRKGTITRSSQPNGSIACSSIYHINPELKNSNTGLTPVHQAFEMDFRQGEGAPISLTVAQKLRHQQTKSLESNGSLRHDAEGGERSWSAGPFIN